MNPSWPKLQSLSLQTAALSRPSPPFKLCPFTLAAERLVSFYFIFIMTVFFSPKFLHSCDPLSAAAPTWADTTTTDQSETVSEAPSTPVPDPAPPRTTRANAGGKKHHFIPKTVCVAQMSPWRGAKLDQLDPFWRSLRHFASQQVQKQNAFKFGRMGPLNPSLSV